MKAQITQEFLNERWAAMNRDAWRMVYFVVMFCALCVWLVPVRAIGVSIAAVLMLIVLGVYLRCRQRGETGDINNAYFRLLAVTDKKEFSDEDDISSFYLCFDDVMVEVKIEEFRAAEIGKMYYVAFFAEKDTAFTCFDAEEYELAHEMSERRRGFFSLMPGVIAALIAVGAILYYGAVWLVVERTKTMPENPPQIESQQ